MSFKFKNSYTIDDLREIMKILRSDNGCPWDREQTHQSIRKNFIEETYEVCEAIDKDDSELLKEELGDVLLQIIFHSCFEEEKNVFTFDDVVTDISKKLIVRHPHVFGDVKVSGVEDVLNNWGEIKQSTKGQTHSYETLEAVPKQLPALMRAQKIQERAKKANSVFGYQNISAVLNDLKSEIAELEYALSHENSKPEEISSEVGDILFAAVNTARFLKLDAETELSISSDKFVKRFKKCEQLAEEKAVDFKSAGTEELDLLWEEAKKSSKTT